MNQRTDRYRKQQKHHRKRKLSGAVIAVVGIVALGALIMGPLSGVMLRPGKVKNLTAEPTYGGIVLNWDSASRADGYVIYENQDGAYKSVGKTEDKKECTYTVRDAAHDEEHVYRVAAYNHSLIGNKDFEGEPSEEISSIYETSKYAQKIPILTYHHVSKPEENPGSGLVVATDKLDEQCKYLNDNGFTTLTLDEFYQWYKGEKEFPVKTVVITFDDGSDSTYYLGYPIIKKYDQAATVFCIGSKTEGKTRTKEEFDNPPEEKGTYVRTDVIQEVREEYPKFAFESHTWDMHTRVKGKKPAVAFSYDQIMEDCQKNERFGFSYLAYPWGTYSDTMQKAVKDSGYKLAFTYRPFYYATRKDDPYAINRIKISGTISMDDYISIVNLEDEECNNPNV